MKYLYSADEAKQIDQHAIHMVGLPGLVLMEKAAMAVAAVLIEYDKNSHIKNRFLAICGTGNNGGDGAAVARILYQQGYSAAIVVVGNEEHMTSEMRAQLKIAIGCGVPILSIDVLNEYYYTVLIDGLFGVGLSRPVTGIYADVIEQINDNGAEVFSLDVPSGVYAGTGQVPGAAICADVTITFGVNKLGLVLFPGCIYAGKVIVADIGLPSVSCHFVEPEHYYYENEDLLWELPQRIKHSNKGNYGKVLVVAGCETMAGAACLAAKAAYKAGAGLVKVISTQNNRDLILHMVPEALFDVRENLEEAIKWASTIVIGPGLGLSKESEQMVRYVVEHAEVPVVIDGDGISLCKKITGVLSENFILTPHVREMSVLTGLSVDDLKADIIGTTRQTAENLHCIMVQKDARTIVSDGTECYVNVSGNNGMATGGSGDVLAGIIGGLLGQHMEPFAAAKLGVFWHGLSGDFMAAKKGVHSLMASDLIEGMPEAILDIEEEKKHGTAI